MTVVALLRHGATAWNEEGRLQGRRDEPLSPAGRAVTAWRLPPEFAGWRWATSPLRRARETASLLGAESVVADPRLVEMDWGEWEGRTLAELRAMVPDMAAREAAGLDFRPDGGETPREVQTRVLGFLRDCTAGGVPTVAVTHKGVIRAMLALSSGWTMRGKPPARLRWDAIHLFALDAAGRPRIERLNVGLAP
jgi:broad specificity phosphatase PhoE